MSTSRPAPGSKHKFTLLSPVDLVLLPSVCFNHNSQIYKHLPPYLPASFQRERNSSVSITASKCSSPAGFPSSIQQFTIPITDFMHHLKLCMSSSTNTSTLFHKSQQPSGTFPASSITLLISNGDKSTCYPAPKRKVMCSLNYYTTFYHLSLYCITSIRQYLRHVVRRDRDDMASLYPLPLHTAYSQPSPLSPSSSPSGSETEIRLVIYMMDTDPAR